MTIYLVTYSNGRTAEAYRSKRAALASARACSPAQYATRVDDAEGSCWYLYGSRSDLHRDRDGAAPHLVEAVVRRVSNTARFIADEDTPSTWRDAVQATTQEG